MADALLKQIKSAKYLVCCCWSWERSFLHIYLKTLKGSLPFLGRDRFKAVVPYVRVVSTLQLTTSNYSGLSTILTKSFWLDLLSWVSIQNRSLEAKCMPEAQKSITWLLGGIQRLYGSSGIRQVNILSSRWTPYLHIPRKDTCLVGLWISTANLYFIWTYYLDSFANQTISLEWVNVSTLATLPLLFGPKDLRVLQVSMANTFCILKQTHVLFCIYTPTLWATAKAWCWALAETKSLSTVSRHHDTQRSPSRIGCYQTQQATDLGVCSHIPPSNESALYEMDRSRGNSSRRDIHGESSLSVCLPLILQQYPEMVGVKFFRDFGEPQRFLGVILRNRPFCTVRYWVSAASSLQLPLPLTPATLFLFLCWVCQDSDNSKLLFFFPESWTGSSFVTEPDYWKQTAVSPDRVLGDDAQQVSF